MNFNDSFPITYAFFNNLALATLYYFNTSLYNSLLMLTLYIIYI